MSAAEEEIDASGGALDLDRQLCFAVYAAAHAYGRLYAPLLKPLGLTYPQYLVMLVLWETDAIGVSAIGERLGLDSGTLTPLLKRLAAAGLVAKSRHGRDERRVVVRLTAEGQALKERAEGVPRAVAGAVGGTQEDARRLRLTLRQLREKLLAAAGK